MYMYVSISNNYLAYATRCCVCDIGVSHTQHDAAYATQCCICDIGVLHTQHRVAYATHFYKKAIFLKKEPEIFFIMLVWTKPNLRETCSKMKNLLMVPRIHTAAVPSAQFGFPLIKDKAILVWGGN